MATVAVQMTDFNGSESAVVVVNDGAGNLTSVDGNAVTAVAHGRESGMVRVTTAARSYQFTPEQFAKAVGRAYAPKF